MPSRSILHWCYHNNRNIISKMLNHAWWICTSFSAICLELLFLLHELEHYHSLAAPLRAFSSGQTAPPLLLASMATFSLFANPVSYLRNMTHDILRMVLKLPDLPNVHNPVDASVALESLSLSLSSCIFHSLCGGHDDQLLEAIRKGEVKIIGKENKEGMIKRCSELWFV